MTPIEAEALLVRYQAAMPQVERADEHGRWELLGEIIDPGPDLLIISLQVAQERGVSKLALTMTGTAQQTVKEQRGRVNHTPRRWLGDDRDRLAAAETVPSVAA